MVELVKRPVTICPENATAESTRPKRASAAATSVGADSGRARLRTRSTTSTWAPPASSSATSVVVGVAEDEVVAAGGQVAGQLGADVVAGVAHDGDASGLGHGSSSVGIWSVSAAQGSVRSAGRTSALEARAR